MKKFLLCIVAGALMTLSFSSCTATKKDCQGVKHYKLKNGIYI